MTDKTARYRQLLQRPQVRALLNTIRYAEGTPGESGYRTMFGGGKFSDLSRHPNRVIKSGGYSSAAAGGYQFLPSTWQGVAGELGLKRFGPEEQDIAALRLIERRGALDPFLKGEKFGKVMDKLAPEWASLPTAAGQSYYGQPVKGLSDLYRVYEEQKKIADAAPATPAPGTGTVQTPVDKGNNLGASLLRSVMGIIPQLQKKRSFLPELQTSDYMGLTTGTSFASNYLQDVARQFMEEV